ncbi:hypothetical protein ACFLTS_03735, partial [Chloroflexota bacterium]
LKSQCDPDIGGAVAGTWHAVVYDTEFYGSGPESTYSAASGNAGYVTEDAFTVQAAAIPEIPTVIAGIGVVGLCFAIYCWMRRRKTKHVKA